MMFRLIFVCLFGLSIADEPGCILTKGEHFNDIVRTFNGKVKQNAILYLYRTSCMPNFDLIDFPPPQHTHLFTYDIGRTLDYTWYQPGPEDDLAKVYGVTDLDCQVVLFFTKGKDFSEPERYYPSSGQTLSQWFWDKHKVSLTITNKLKDSVIVTQEVYGKGPSVMPGTVEPGETVTIPSYTGYLVIGQTMAQKHTYYNEYMTTRDQSVTLTLQRPVIPLEDVKKTEYEKHRGTYAYLKAVALRHLAMLKQPLFVHNLTPTGYEVMKMPPKLYKEIFNAYIERFDEGVEAEDEDLTVQVRNPLDQKAKDIRLTDRVKWSIVDLLRPVLNKWCNCKVKFNEASPIRIYLRNSRVFKHVTPVDKGSIAVILNIDKDLGSAEDWPLQVIGFDGIPTNVTINQGQMVLLEGSKVIHGFPSIFQGKRFVNAYFYFTPNANWPYTKTDVEFINSSTGEVIDIGTDLMTPFTYKRRVVHDEL